MKKTLLYLSFLCLLLAITYPCRLMAQQTYSNETASVVWPFTAGTNEVTKTPDTAFTLTSFSATGDCGGNSNSSESISGTTFLKFNGSNVIEFNVKPTNGLTFTPTKISANIRRCGTDGGTIDVAVKNEDGTTETLATGLIPLRNNKTLETDKHAGEAKLTDRFELNVPAALATSKTFTLVITVNSLNANKQAAFNNVHIEGSVNGTTLSATKFSINTSLNINEAGTVTTIPNGNSFDEGTVMKVSTTRNFGYKFVNWTDGNGKVVSEDNNFTYILNANTEFTANYEKINTYALNCNVEGGAADYMLSIAPAPTVVDNKNMYEKGTEVTLSASGNDILTFNNWNDGQTSSEIKMTMNENKNIVATYSAIDFIAAWDFYKACNNGRKADFYSTDNDADQLVLRDAAGNSVSWLDKSQLDNGGYEGRPGAVNWHKDAAIGNYYWQIKVNAKAFTSLKVKNAMVYNYNAYKTYNVEYSLDDSNWTKIGSITIDGAKNWKDSEISLPTAADNQSAVYIRWIADKTSAINGTESELDGSCMGAIYVLGTEKVIDDGNAPKLISTIPAESSNSASANGKIVLTFDEKVKLSDNVSATLNAESISGEVSGKTITFTYKGLNYATAYTFTLQANSISDVTGNAITEEIKINFTTKNKDAVTKTKYDFIVPDDGNFREAIDAANKRTDTGKRYRIFVKKGSYTFPASTTATVTGSDNTTYADPAVYITTANVSIIGEDMNSTVVTNTVPKNSEGSSNPIEGIGKGDVIKLQGNAANTYFEDITLKSGMADATGRNIVLNDGGNKTICKDVTLYGYQDTYVSNNNNGKFYFEGGVIRGRTDYICGKGDVFYNGVEFRNCDKGGYIAVPSLSKKYGYIMRDCNITGENDNIDGNYTLGRPWGSGTPVALWINTKMNVVPSAIGWNEMGNGYPARFAEYNSQTSTGTVIDLSNRKTTFADTHSNNPILTAEEATLYTVKNVMGQDDDWDPTETTEQASAPTNVQINNGTITWDANDYAMLWAIAKDGKVIAFTTEPSYTISDYIPNTIYSVRAANEMGGLGEATVATSTETKAQPAFPGAEGFGMYTTGGRSGNVYHVTTLEDNTDKGSFRWANSQSGPRTIVFDISGTIHLKSALRIAENTTVAGQTAPGDGICFADYPVTMNSNVIMRFVRFRLGNVYVANHEGDGLGSMDANNIIVDHCSVSWSIDECISVYGGKNLTVQWSIGAQSLVNAGHSKGAHGYGGNWGGSGCTYHHNLLAHHTSRVPRLGPRPGTQTDERLDMRNNVFYNWAGNGCYGGEGMNVNIVNNYYKVGPATETRNTGIQQRIASIGIRTSEYTGHGTGTVNSWDKMWHVWGKYYVNGNVNSKYDNVTKDNWTYGIYNQIDNSKVDNTFTQETKDTMKITSPVAFYPVTTQTAEDAYNKVLQYSGASLHRDALDDIIISDTKNGTATFTGSDNASGFVNTQNDVASGISGTDSPWPALNSTAALTDTDGDGMPDSWETTNGLNPNNASDGKTTNDDGYTNLEHYINSIVQGIMTAESEGGTVLKDQQTTAINNTPTANNAKIKYCRYYNISGCQINKPHKGVNIIVAEMTDGTIKKQKLILR